MSIFDNNGQEIFRKQETKGKIPEKLFIHDLKKKTLHVLAWNAVFLIL